jgi:hypothetical protein
VSRLYSVHLDSLLIFWVCSDTHPHGSTMYIYISFCVYHFCPLLNFTSLPHRFSVTINVTLSEARAGGKSREDMKKGYPC